MPEEAENKLTSIQTDSETSRMLGEIADAHERSKAAQLRVMVKRHYDELGICKLLPVEVERRRRRSSGRRSDDVLPIEDSQEPAQAG
jgi:hypothetical protein